MILNRQHRVRVAVAPLEDFLARVRRQVRLPADALTVCLVSDAEMARWNASYRSKRGPTDVLSFPTNGNDRKQGKQRAQGEAEGGRRGKGRRGSRGGAVRASSWGSFPSSSAFFSSSSSSTSFISSASYLGDIAIAPGVALRNARRFGRSLPEELRILILHGVLHLLGYDHESDDGEMDRYESRLRRRLGLS